VPAIKLMKVRALKLLWAIYPLIVTFVVISTGNHFWTDAALGVVVAGISAWVATFAFARVRPEAWAWRSLPAEAGC
jgi:hypothetical protein